MWYLDSIGSSGTLTIGRQGLDVMTFANSGKVGIGTSSPAAKLEVEQATGGEGLRIDGASGGFALVVEGGSSYKSILRNASIGTSYFGNTAPTDGLIVEGNVGIGTTSPTQTLHIDGSARITGAIYDSNNAAGTSGQILSSTGTGTDWVTLSEISGVDGTGTANYISKWSDTDTITDSQIQDDGTTVGIGQAPSTAKLTVSGDIQTAAPETTTASAWKLGNVGLGGVFVGAADYVTVSVGGLVVKLPIAIFPETQDYYDRVIADGGTFEGLLGYESAVTILKAE